MHALQARADARGQQLRFIVLHISNDPALDPFIAPRRYSRAHFMPVYAAGCAAIARGRPGLRGEAVAPLQALMDTRNARGSYARTEWLGALRFDPDDPPQGDLLWHFRLCAGGYPIPLGWTVSTPVFDEMQQQLTDNYPVAAMARALARQLGGPTTASAVANGRSR